MPTLRDRLNWWWTFRDVKGEDPTLTVSGDKTTIQFGTRARFKGCLSVEVSPADLRLLRDQLDDFFAEPRRAYLDELTIASIEAGTYDKPADWFDPEKP